MIIMIMMIIMIIMIMMIIMMIMIIIMLIMIIMIMMIMIMIMHGPLGAHLGPCGLPSPTTRAHARIPFFTPAPLLSDPHTADAITGETGGSGCHNLLAGVGKTN